MLCITDLRSSVVLGSRLRLPQSVGLTCDAKLLDRSRQPSWVTASVVELRGSRILSTRERRTQPLPAPGRRLRSSASRSSIVRISRGWPLRFRSVVSTETLADAFGSWRADSGGKLADG